MNKAELIDKVANDTGLTKKDAKAAVETVFEAIKEASKKDEGVQIAGFGSFVKVKRNARTARNPQTGESIKVKASTSVRFKPAKAFKDIFQKKK